MIGRQMWWMISFNSWHPIYLQWLMVIIWDGSWQRTGILLSARIIISYTVLLPLFFHGKVKALRCVSFFVWIATWDRILTGDNLRLRGFDFVDWCIMCYCCGETVDHLLFHCGKAYQLWCFVFRIFRISSVPSYIVSDFLFGWWNWLEKHSSHSWNLVPLCLMLCIWRERDW